MIEALGSTDLNLLVDVEFNKEVAQDCALYWSREGGSLASLIDKADSMSFEEISSLGKKAKMRVSKEYTWKKFVLSMKHCLQKRATNVKILVIHNFHRKGSASGDDQVFKSEKKLLESNGHEVITYTVSNDSFDNLGIYGKLLATFGMLWSFGNYKAVKSLILKEQPDLVHVHTFFHYCLHQYYMQLKVAVKKLLQRFMIRDLFVHVLHL